MDNYKELAKQLVEDYISDNVPTYIKTRKEALEALLEDTQDVFGNLSGSRTVSAYKAQEFINKANAVFDEDIIELYAELGDNYMANTLARGAEAFDVVTLELVAPQVINAMLEANQ